MEKIDQRILRFIRTLEGDFGALALDLFTYQFAANAPYRAYATGLGKIPATVRTWKEIPAVPVAAFKTVNLATFPVPQAAAHFESSGTSQQVTSHHYLKTLTYYETSLQASFQKNVLRDQAKLPFLIVTPSPADAPRSSLAWMMDVVKRRLGAAGSRCFVSRGRVDELFLITFLSKAQAEHEPVALLGTTIAWTGVMDYLEKTQRVFKLPPGSRLMDTGGLKTERRDFSREDFVRRVGERFGIPEDQCVNEYGMCELSSQCYGRGTGSLLQGPPWMRTLVIDPETGEESAAGRTGMLRHFDLANIDSVLAIQTEDLGRIDSGSDTFELLGRAPNADVRGCSLSAEAFLHERADR